MKTINFSIALFLLLFIYQSQSNNFEQELSAISSQYQNEKKIDAVNYFISNRLIKEPQKSLDVLNSNLKESQKINYKYGIAETYHNLGRVYFLLFFYVESDSLLKIASEKYISLNNNEKAVHSLIDRSKTLKEAGKVQEALSVLKNALFYADKGNTSLKPLVHQEIGNVYIKLNDIDEAISNLRTALELSSKDKNKYMMSFIFVDLGIAYLNSASPLEAQQYFLEARKLFENEKNQVMIAETYMYEGNLNQLLGNIEIAAQNYLKAYNLFDFIKEKNGMQKSLYELYQIEQFRNNYEKSFEYLEKYAKLLREELDFNLFQKQMAKKITAEASQRQIAQNKMFEKDKELNYIKNQNEIQRLESEKKSAWITLFSFISILLIIIAVILFYLIKTKNKTNLVLTEINSELNTKNRLIDFQKNELETKNDSILDSINYAKRIQNAILPIEETSKSLFKDHFILYLPKDIVSGDFYWFAQKDKYTFAAVVDCTGHGVPGAFMSMIGHTLLNEIVTGKSIYEPAKILTSLNKKIRTVLKQDFEIGANDGMDMALIRIDNNTSEILFAGAKRPVYYVEDSVLYEIKGDKLSIGGRSYNNITEFNQHKIELKKNSFIYLFSDGFTDQNDTENNKYGIQNFKTLLESISNLSADEQFKKLSEEFFRHKGDEPQRDDVTVLGLKIDK